MLNLLWTSGCDRGLGCPPKSSSTVGLIKKQFRKNLAVSETASVRPTPKDAMKLRMTGFECSPSFVILRTLGSVTSSEVEARHCTATLVSVFHKDLMSFPINFDAGISLSTSSIDCDNLNYGGESAAKLSCFDSITQM